mmetsp:Transcript_37836/g.57902  ORF Transcript_37836/g.57902 Transcript_37836/m.57902 type:complete len:83 (+) Transcript_37836:310-558(+)
MEKTPNRKQYSAYIFKMKDAGKGQRLMYPLELEPSHKVKYFEIEEPFNPLNYMKDPYMLMIGFGVLMMYMMKAMPKDELEQA